MEKKIRLDKRISDTYDLSRADVKEILEKGIYFSNKGNNLKSSIKLTELEFENLNIKLDLERLKKEKELELKESKYVSDKLMESVKIIYEDEYIYVISKPAGLIVESKITKEPTLVDVMKKKEMILADSEKEREGIIHRLDKETSGLLIIAKTNEAKLKFQEIFKSRKVIKKYKTIVHGIPEHKTGKIDMPIKRSLKNRTQMEVSLEGKKAITYFKLIEKLHGFSLVEVNIITGRTHQIRVHFKAINHPVLGDKSYSSLNYPDKLKTILKRQMLHSYYLEFIHPFTNKKVILEDKLPEDFEKVLTILREK